MIIPPGGSVTDDEDINDKLNDEITLNDLQEITGTFEINRPIIVEEVDFETVKRNVGDIVNSDDSIDGKVNKLIEHASVLKGLCQWSVGKEQSGLGAEQSDRLSGESLENRKVLIEQRGEKFPFEYFELLFDEEF